MKKRVKIILSLAISVLLLFAAGIFTHKSIAAWRFDNAANAAGALPYQIGLTNVTIIPCFTTGEPPLCTGGTLCHTLDLARCTGPTGHSDVSGTPAGGMGSNALFLNTAIIQAGLTTGGQLIAGGMSSVLMDSGVLASAGGCYGCMAKAGAGDKFFAWLEKLDKFIIAGFRGK